MSSSVFRSREAQQKHDQDKADGSLFLRRQHEDLAPCRLPGTRALHSDRGLTWSDRYLCRMFWS
jgi:hypothetical protein